MKSILDKSFVYRDSASTNIRLTFAKARREIKAEKEAEAKPAAKTPKVVPLTKRAGK